MKLLRKSLRNWDVASSDGVHYFIAISRYVEERIRRHYGRGAEVIYPPVDFDAFSAVRGHDDFYLMVTAFAPYKRVDLAVEAFNTLKKPLKIVGTGQDERKVRALAGPTVELLGWRPDGDVRNYYARCKALIFPGEEDFGIVPLEAMASGKPVIAYGKGGALETVMPLNPLGHAQAASPAPTGVFFYEPTVQSLIEAVRLFETHAEDFDPTAIRAHVAPFDKTCFKQKIHEAIMRSYGHFHPSNLC
jgi:glycosyltransferase involved in cell wall biosynthesis